MSIKPLIAIVDDDAAIRIGLSSLLRSAGYAVELFDSAEDFLGKFPAAFLPRCLITDIQMPGISGLELLTQLQATWPTIPVLAMTAFPGPAVRARALAGGAICFLSKPFDAIELLECVEHALAR